MTQGASSRPFRTVTALALPTVATYLCFAAREFSDAFMIARCGDVAMAGAMSAQQVLFMGQAFAFGLFSALNTCASHAEERDGPEGATAYTWQCVWLALILGLSGLALRYISVLLFTLTGHEFPVFQLEVQYFNVSLYALLPQFMAVVLSNFFFAARQTVIPMVAGALHVLINVAVNYALMFGVPGWIDGMGAIGAAWGTLIASTAWALMLLAAFLFSPRLKPFKTWKISFSPSRMRYLLRLGIPNGAIDLVDAFFWSIALVVLIGQFGTQHLAAGGFIIKLWTVLIIASDGQSVAIQTLVGHSLAAGKEKAAHEFTWAGIVMSGASMGLIGLICLIFGEEFFGGFIEDPAVLSIVLHCMTIFPLLVLADGILFTLDASLNGAGDALWPLLVAFFCHLSMIAGGGWLVSRFYPDLGSLGIWYCILANRASLALVYGVRWVSGGWRKFRPVGP